MHRFIMGLGPGDPREVDHLNHNGLDNRRENLRIVSHLENGQNRRIGKRGYRTLPSGKHQARILVDGTPLNLGVWDDPRLARAAYLCGRQLFHHIGG